MKAAVLSIGTELTRGEITNTNATWLCEQLTSLGATVLQAQTVDDDPPRIQHALRELSRTADVIVSTGGLGPTTDDLTAQTVAAMLNVPLERDSESLIRIRERLARYGYTLSASNAKQADLPRGCTVLPNDYGTAPGFMVHLTPQSDAYFLPGVPREMRGIFLDRIQAALRSKLGSVRSHQEQLRVFGMPESQVNDALAGVEEAFGVTVGYRAHFPEVYVKALAFRDNDGDAKAASLAAAAEIERRLGDKIYARGDQSLVSAVADLLRSRAWTLGLAESCTGGLVAQMVTLEPASDYFRGGVVCYDNDVKRRLLGVSRETLETQGAVSRDTVLAMAHGVRDALNAEVGLAFSGIAGPTGGTETKPVGLVHFAVVTPIGVEAREQVFSGDRAQIQRRAAFAGLDLLRRVLLPASA
jgi:nicotinamide-nucleotide amidase